MAKLIKISVSLLIFGIGLSIFLVAFLLSTASGTRWVFAQLERYDLLTYQTLEGTIISGLHIEELNTNLPAATLKLHRLYAHLSFSRLIAGEIYLHTLGTETMEIWPKALANESPAHDQTSDPVLLNKLREGTPLLPLSLSIKQLAIQTVTIHPIKDDPQGTAQKINNLQFSGTLNKHGVENLALSLTHQNENRKNVVSLNASIESWEELKTQLNLIWSSTSDTELSIHGELEVKGNRQQLLITHHTDGDLISNIQGTLNDWLNQPYISLNSDIDTLKNHSAQALYSTRLTLDGTPNNIVLTANSRLQTNGHDIPIALHATWLDTVLTLKQLRLETTAGAVEANGTLTEANGTFNWQGQLVADNFALNSIHTALPETLNGQIAVHGSFHPERDTNKLTFSFNSKQIQGTLHGQPYALKLKGKFLNQQLSLEQGQLTLDGNDLNATGYAALNPDRNTLDTLDLHIAIDVPHLDKVIPKAHGTFTATAQVSGTLDQSVLTANSLLKTNGHDIPIALHATWLDKVLTLKQLRLETTAGAAEVSGTLKQANDIFNWQGQLVAHNFALNPIHTALPETLNGQIAVHGSFHPERDKNKLTLFFNSKQIQGRLHGQPYALKLKGKFLNQQLSLEQGQLTVHDNSLNATGQANLSPDRRTLDTLDLHIAIEAPRINEILPEAGGALTATAQLSGTLKAPDLTFNAHLSDLSYQQLGIAEASLQWVVEQGTFKTGSNRLMLTDAHYNRHQFDTINLAVSGTLERPSIMLNADTPQGQIALQSDHILDNNSFSGKLTSLLITEKSAAQWQLDAPVSYHYHSDSGAWSISPFCLRQDAGHLCVEASGDTLFQTLSVKAQALPLAWLNPMLEIPFAIQGAIDWETQLTVQTNTPSIVINGHVELRRNQTSPIELIPNVMPNHPVQIETFNTRLDIHNNQAHGVLDLALNKSNGIQGHLQLSDITESDSPLDATLIVTIPDLSPYTQLIPSIKIPSGQVQGEFKLGNRLQHPDIRAQLLLSIPTMHVYPLNVDWHQLNLELRSINEKKLTVNGQLKAGDGQLTIGGELDLSSLTDWQSQFSVHGKHALLANHANQRLVANPDLNIKVSSKRAMITGELLIPDATFQFKAQPGRLSLTQDAIIHRNEAHLLDKKQDRFALLLDILIRLGDNVRFLAYGLDTKLRGNVSLNKKNDQSLLGQGELQLLDGTYQAYGQRLQIEHGTIEFTGDLAQPAIDLRAFRQVGNVKAGLKVSGSINNLQSLLYSEPALVDTEILSYLILGKPPDELNDTNQNYLSSAALSYAIRRSTPASEKISDWLALDEASINAESDTDSLGFNLGKYITPDLYVRYGYGVISKLNKLFTQYRLTDGFYLESEIGEGQSVDLIYKSN